MDNRTANSQEPDRRFTCLRTALLLAAGAMTAVGCTVTERMEQPGTKPYPIDKALHQMQLDLTRVHVLVPSNLTFVDPALPDAQWRATPEVKEIEDIIANDQCFAIDRDGNVDYTLQKKNPLIAVSTGPLQLSVQGQLSTAGTFTISVTPSAGGTVTRAAQQQLMVPLTLVSLATLPTFYIGQQMANIQNITLVSGFKPVGNQPLADAQMQQVAQYVTSILNVGAALNRAAADSMTQYTDHHGTWCQGREHGGTSFVAPAAQPPAAPAQ